MSILCLPSYVATPSPLTLRFFFFQCSADHRDLHSFPTRRSSDLFEETLEVLLGAWTNERFAYRGRYVTIPEVHVIPKPLQQPHPPLYVVCVSPDTIEATALRGLPMLNSLLRASLDPLVQQRDTYIK